MCFWLTTYYRHGHNLVLLKFTIKQLEILQIQEKKKGVLAIYTAKPEIPVGRSNGSRHSVWEASENLGFDLW